MSIALPPPESLPRHVAIVMDGNGRWATQRQLPRFAGHRAGVKRVREIVRICSQCGIQVLTLFAFSSENWRRPPTEVSLLMQLFVTTLRHEIRELHRENVRFQVIGARQAFPQRLQNQIQAAETRTAANTGLILIVAANYGGRWDITTSAQRLAERVAKGTLLPADITPALFEREVCLNQLPEPDLFIRSGGEKRISNFLLWQIAYSEIYFTDILWPDFDEIAFTEAMCWFASRQRRFGQTGEQIKGQEAISL